MNFIGNTVIILLVSLAFHIFISGVKAKDNYVTPGSNVTIECPFNRGFAPGDSSLNWNGPLSTDVISRDDKLNPNLPQNVKERLAIVGNYTSGEYNLHVSGVTSGDNGSYFCLTNKNGVLYNRTSGLFFLEAPSDVYVHVAQPDNTIRGTEGENLTITCTAVGGKPPPEVTLSSNNINYNVSNQTVDYVFRAINRSLDLRELICQANSPVLQSPLQKKYKIYLQLKPLTPTLSPQVVNTEETRPIEVSCTSTGSRPAATFQWSIGKDNVTYNSTTQSSQNTDDGTYKVTSILRKNVDRKNDGQTITCWAYNNISTSGVLASTTLSVRFAPSITVMNDTYNQNVNKIAVTCIPDGNPTTYTYSRWQHKSSYGEVIRELDGGQNGVLTLPSVSVEDRYQDSGEYVCTAGNNITGRNGKIEQTGSGYVTVNAQPAFLKGSKETEYGEIGKNVTINVFVYSVPIYTTLKWYKSKGEISTTDNKYSSTVTNAIVTDTFHNTTVQLNGYRVTLTIKNLLELDFNVTYRVELSNGVGQTAAHTTLLVSASPPQTPENFTVLSSSESSVLFQWVAGYNGGYEQKFYVEYRKVGSDKWQLAQIPSTITEQRGRQTYTLTDLNDDSMYELRMYAENKFNTSVPTQTERIQTIKDSQTSKQIGGIIGGVAGGLAAVLTIIGIVWFMIFKRKQDPSIHSKALRSRSDSEVPDGLQHNILYQTAGSDFKPLVPKIESEKLKQKPSTSETEYAEVQKPNALYAAVDKTVIQKNVQDQKQKDKKKKQKKTFKKVDKGNNEDGEYSNAGMSLKDMGEGEYANAEDRSCQPTSHKNQQGLEYADLSFTKQIPQKGKKPVIHGEEDRTLYSEVDHSKKAPPPPQEGAYEETNFKHG